MAKKLPGVKIRPDTPNYVQEYETLKKIVSKKTYHGEKIKTSLCLPKSLYKAFSIKTRQHDTTMHAMFIRWIEDYINE
jgi:hypothetical protein